MYGSNPNVNAEIERVEAAGGWVADGRVCDVIAVSRAFGDVQFKEEAGRQDMLQTGIECVQSDSSWTPRRCVTLLSAANCCMQNTWLQAARSGIVVNPGRRNGQWDQEFVDSVSFRESPIVAAPDVTEMPLRPDDEFLVIASDGLW